MPNGGPQIFVNIEKIKESVVIDNELDSLKSHVMKLITCFQDLIFCLFTDDCHSLFIPVGVTFAKRPLKSSIITVHNLVPFAIGHSAACWTYHYPLQIIRNISFLLVQLTSNLIWVARKGHNECYDNDVKDHHANECFSVIRCHVRSPFKKPFIVFFFFPVSFDGSGHLFD